MKTIMVSTELLLEIKSLIENIEEALDSEWGKGRYYQDIATDGDMPKEYYELVKILESTTEKPTIK